MKAWRRSTRGPQVLPAGPTDVTAEFLPGPSEFLVTWAWAYPNPESWLVEYSVNGGAWQFGQTGAGALRSLQFSAGGSPGDTWQARIAGYSVLNVQITLEAHSPVFTL